MRAVALDQADRAGGRAIRDEVLAEQAHAQRRALGLRQLARQRGRYPVLAQQIPHGRARAHAAEQLVVLAAQHQILPGTR